jgi:hypothetical protein
MLEVSLNADAWHRRLQMWVFDDPSVPKIPNLCPYFWLTVLSLVIVVPIGVWRGTISVIAYPISLFVKDQDEVRKQIEYMKIASKTEHVVKIILLVMLALVGGIFPLVMISIEQPMILMVVLTLGICLMALIAGIAALAEHGFVFPGWTTAKPLLGRFFTKVLAPFPLFGGFIQGIYHKMCPGINWLEER